jgi:hypothetical protein
LEPQLLSAQYSGKAWHAITGVRTFEAGESLLGLLVDPTNQSTCSVILWQPQSSLPTIPSLPNTAPMAIVVPSTTALGASARLTIRLWDAEGNAALPFLQYQFLGSTNWQDITNISSSGRYLATAPTGINYTLFWNARTDIGEGVVTNVLLRARAQDFMLVGDWSVPTPFRVEIPLGPPTNNISITNPQFSTTNGFQFTVTSGLSGQSYTLYASTNLVNWDSINNGIFRSPPLIISDPAATNFRWRFYKVGQ